MHDLRGAIDAPVQHQGLILTIRRRLSECLADSRWRQRRSHWLRQRAWIEQASAVAAIAALLIQAEPIYFPVSAASDASGLEMSPSVPRQAADGDARTADRETLIAGYFGIPDHYRSDVHVTRPDGTNLTMKALHWEGEPFHFPLYAGLRYVRWNGAFGGMVDFLHDKAVARTGKGAHGRRLTGNLTIPETVEMAGQLKGAPAPASAKITDVIERLEFSHGHNVLLPTFLMRIGKLAPQLHIYAGIGAGVAIPHVEVWPAGEGEDAKTNEYQYAGPAGQFVLGLESQGSRGSLFLEYKFTLASLSTALTGGKTPSWCNCDIVSDTIRHVIGWWHGDVPRYGHLETMLSGHQLVGGAGYRTGSGGGVPAL